MPQQVPSPRRHLSLVPSISYGERVRVRGDQINRDDSDCPSPQPSPRANDLIQLMNSGGEREPVEAAGTLLRARTPYNLLRPVPSPRRHVSLFPLNSYGERVRVRGDQINRDDSDSPSLQPSPRVNDLIQLMNSGGEREFVASILKVRPHAAH